MTKTAKAVVQNKPLHPLKRLEQIKMMDSTLAEYALAIRSADSDSIREVEIRDFFDGEEYVSTREDTVSVYQHNKIQFILDEFLKKNNYEIVEKTNYGYMEKTPPEYSNMEISPGKFVPIYSDATLFLKKGQNKVVFTIYYNDHNGAYSYTFYHSPTSKGFLQDLNALADEKNFYRGQKIDASCRFLKLDKSTWDDVIIPEKKKKVIAGSVNDIISNMKEFKEFGVNVKRGVILHGVPGNGKTQICRALANGIECSVLYVLPRDFSADRGGVKRLAFMAKDLAPCLLIIEDIDYVASDRSLGSSGLVIELMNYLDGLEYFGDIITIGTTNHIDVIENAIKNRPGRFDRVIEIEKPEKPERVEMIRFFTKRYDISSLEKDLSKIGDCTKGLTGAHMRDLCNTAAMNAVQDRSIRVDGDQKTLVLKFKHFQVAVKEVSKKDLATYSKQQSTGKLGFNSEPAGSLDDLLGEESDGW